MVDVHCEPDVHLEPLATVPQELLRQGSPAQSVPAAHVVLHAAVPLHVKGAQLAVEPCTQCPAPSHVDAFAKTLVPPLQDALPQGVALPHSLQLPRPSHVPSCPQVDAFATAQLG